MKIIASIFLFPLAFLLFQPLLNNETSGAKKECASTQCHKKKKDQGKKKECDNCNPFMACALCNLFTRAKEMAIIKTIAPADQKISLINDNRLFSRSSDCWHPPEAI